MIAKLTSNDFMEIGEWALCTTRDAKSRQALAHRFPWTGLKKNFISCFGQATGLKIQSPQLALSEETGNRDHDSDLQKVSLTKFITQKCFE